MAVKVKETEVTYEIPTGSAVAGLDTLPEVAEVRGPRKELLEAEYYDTGDLRLLRAGVTLRRRQGGGDAGWHLKLPDGGATRREIRDEPDAVHQMRVATRRLRSTLRSFDRIVRGDRTRRLASELKWLGTVLGTVRDAEVLVAHMQAGLRDMPTELVIGPAQARLQGHFGPVCADARTDLLATLDSGRYFALLDELDTLLAEPQLTPEAARPAAEILPAAVRQPYRQTARRMRRAGRARQGQPMDEALHEARKAAKRARYASEAAAPAVGKEARRLGKRMRKVQSVLGDHHDTVVARQAERQLGIMAHLAGENAFSYGLLYGRDACSAEHLQAQARRAWKRASRPRYRKWLG